MSNPLNPCPYCGMKSVDITTQDSTIKTFLCTGPQFHEWTDDLNAEPEQEPLILLP